MFILLLLHLWLVNGRALLQLRQSTKNHSVAAKNISTGCIMPVFIIAISIKKKKKNDGSSYKYSLDQTETMNYEKSILCQFRNLDF